MNSRSTKVKLGLLILILVVVFIPKRCSIIPEPKTAPPPEIDIGSMTDEELAEYSASLPKEYVDWTDTFKALQNTTSDLGISMYVKAILGLNPENDSDTDGDGLTDREEIFVYHSDPKKSSTAGDLYYDGYKVEHGMDLHTYYEREGGLQYRDETELCAGIVTLFPSVPESARVSVHGNGCTVPENFEIYKEFTIAQFGGKIAIDFNAVETLKGKKNVDIAIQKTATCVFCDYHIGDDGLVYLDYDFDYDYYYAIIIGKSFDPDKENKKTTHENLPFYQDYSRTSPNSYSSTDSYTSSVLTNEDYFIYGTPLFNGELFPARVYYSSDATPLQLDHVITCAEDLCDNPFTGNHLSETKQVSSQKLSFMRSAFDKLLGYFKFDGVNKKFRHILFFYCDYYDILNEEEKAAREAEEQERLSHFVPEIDTLPFANFPSEYAGGNCVGIAHLTSYLYNNKTFPSSGSYRIGFKNVEWDLTTDEENATLMDRGLLDYKGANFVNKHRDEDGVLTKNLSEGERQFVDMIACAWKEGNKKAVVNDYALFVGKSYEYELVEKMMDYIDNNKILDVSLLLSDNQRHAVNIYDYHYDEEDKDVIHFSVYDNNYPYASIASNKKKLDSFTLNIKIYRDDQDNPIGFDYEYHPITGSSDYYAASKDGCNYILFSMHSMVVADDQWNVFNERRNLLGKLIQPDMIRNDEDDENVAN